MRVQGSPSRLLLAAAALLVLVTAGTARAQSVVVPPALRGSLDAERSGTHDANNLRTVFWNYGMVGDYPSNPGNVDLSVFHSVEVPKGTGMNYSDGITPFVLAKIQQTDGTFSYIMETGFRERQDTSPRHFRIMRFEPRPGYFQADPTINKGRSPAMSNDPRTWPNSWPDKAADPDDPGWAASWNGYFGKRPAADQESYTVMDDDFYDAWRFYPDSRDSSRFGLGLRVEVRGFQWANPQAGNVIFWHYDITNEGTTNYDNNIIFGLYMDSGVGGSGLSCDGIFESDDDVAFFDKSSGLNLVYTYDRFGHGVDLSGNCAKTGYLGYAYLETPGNATNGIDDDNDGITDESRDSGPGSLITGKDAIRAYVAAHYDTTKFTAFYGAIDKRPAYRAGRWWTGDEDLDWNADTDDVGADGVADTHDLGEGDGMPTNGEPNFDKTDKDESDQIGLTGFKFNRIKSGQGNPDPTTDGVLFYTDQQNWPQRLFEKFSDPYAPARFDSLLASNYNIAFLFASGPFRLDVGQQERFSLALAYGATLPELRSQVKTVQQIYNANYQFAVPPKQPTATAEVGDHRVRLSWDDVAEQSVDPVSHEKDFEGYRIYRATDPEFRDARLVTNGQGSDLVGNGRPIAQFDLIDQKNGYSRLTVNGVAYWLGTDTGLTHTWTDTTVTNGQQYYYAVCAYDYGFDNGVDSLSFYPSENAIAVSRTPRGGTILPTNVVSVRPNAKVGGYEPAVVDSVTKTGGTGTGSVAVQVVNSALVPDRHLFAVQFTVPDKDSVRATTYTLIDSTTHQRFFKTGTDFLGAGTGPVAAGLLAVVTSDSVSHFDAAHSGYDAGAITNTLIKAAAQAGLSPNLRRAGWPDDITIAFDNVARDTSVRIGLDAAKPTKFTIIAHSDTGDVRLKCRFRDRDNDGTLSRADEFIDIVTYAPTDPLSPQPTWRVQLDTLGQGARGAIIGPKLGDTYQLRVIRPLNATDTFTFTTGAEHVDASKALAEAGNKPYVVPNPYVAAASFEPQRFADSGRGDRRMEFRNIPLAATIRIFTVHGDLVRTLRQDGSTNGFVPWDLRTKDNLDVAPGLYVFHVDGPGVGTFIGKFAIIK
jgi:hypothetical protein